MYKWQRARVEGAPATQCMGGEKVFPKTQEHGTFELLQVVQGKYKFYKTGYLGKGHSLGKL